MAKGLLKTWMRIWSVRDVAVVLSGEVGRAVSFDFVSAWWLCRRLFWGWAVLSRCQSRALIIFDARQARIAHLREIGIWAVAQRDDGHGSRCDRSGL